MNPFLNPLYIKHFEPWPAHYFLSWNLLISMIVGFCFVLFLVMKVEKAWSRSLVALWGVTLPIGVSYCETFRMWGCSQGCFWWFDNDLHAAFWVCLCPSWLKLHLNQHLSVNHSFIFNSFPLIFPFPNILRCKSIFCRGIK